MDNELSKFLFLVFPIRSQPDLKEAARTLQSLIDARHPGAIAFLRARSIAPDAVRYSHLLDLVANLARLRDWSTAQKVLPAELESLEFVLRRHDEALDGRAADAEAAGLRFLPSPLAERPALDIDLENRVLDMAASVGFAVSHTTKKKIELVNSGAKRVVYLDRNRSSGGTIAIIVQPTTDLSALLGLEGVRVPPQSLFYNSSNLRCYPRHEHRGKNQIPYGYSIVCDTLGSAQRLLSIIGGAS